MRSLLLILVSVFMSATGQVMLKAGANKLGAVFLARQDILQDIWRIFKTPQILIGIGLFATGFLTWMKVLTREDLSFAYPMASLSYVIILIYSYFLFRESITASKLIGIILIITGIIFIHR